MCIIEMDIRGWHTKDTQITQLAVADLVRLALSRRFGTTTIEKVTISPSFDVEEGLQLCSIHMIAECPNLSLPSHQRELDEQECTVEDIISGTLQELFEIVSVDKVLFRVAAY